MVSQHIFLGLVLIGINLCFPQRAYSLSSAMTSSGTHELKQLTNTATALNIEERLVFEGDIPVVSYNRTFKGNRGDAVIFELDREDHFGYSLDTLSLSSPTGEEIYPDYHSDYTSFDYFGDPYMVFMLPETGEYTFFLEIDNWSDTSDARYLVKLRFK